MNFTDYCCPARPSALASLLTWLEDLGARAGLDGDEIRRLQLVVEELFANTLEHGFSGESDRPVIVSVAFPPNGVLLDYQDEAPPFDPLALPPAAKDAEYLGGQGLRIVESLAKTMNYRHIDGKNSIRVELPRKG